MTELALEIVHYAVLDWRRLVKAKAWKIDYLRPAHQYWQIPNVRCNFDELRLFFKSDWCDLLLTVNHVATTGQRILQQLEKELEAAKESEKRQARRKKQKKV